jgi:transcriptional regulator
VYQPRHFTVSDLAQIEALVESAGTADLVTFDGVKPVATLMPVIWDRPAGPDGADTAGADTEGEPDYGRLLGHLALANDQWRTAQPGAQALAIVHGAQAYISPSWYESTARHGRTVPTWNYEAVHLTGTVEFHHDPEWLRAMVTRLSDRYESFRPRPWLLTDAPPDYIEGQLRAIVGIELTVTSVAAVQKLTQNRSTVDQEGTVAGLRGEPGPGAAQIADLMAGNLERDKALSARHG